LPYGNPQNLRIRLVKAAIWQEAIVGLRQWLPGEDLRFGKPKSREMGGKMEGKWRYNGKIFWDSGTYITTVG